MKSIVVRFGATALLALVLCCTSCFEFSLFGPGANLFGDGPLPPNPVKVSAYSLVSGAPVKQSGSAPSQTEAGIVALLTGRMYDNYLMERDYKTGNDYHETTLRAYQVYTGGTQNLMTTADMTINGGQASAQFQLFEVQTDTNLFLKVEFPVAPAQAAVDELVAHGFADGQQLDSVATASAAFTLTGKYEGQANIDLVYTAPLHAHRQDTASK